MSQGSNATGSQPTQKEAFFFLNIMNSMKNKPDVDWDIVAQKSGYSNGACAQTRFRQIKRRLGYTDDGAAPSASPAKSRTPKKEKVNGSGTNKNASKVKKTPTKAKNGRVSKAEFAEAALLHSNEEDKFSVRNHGNSHAKDEDETSGSYSYDSEDHAENIEGYDEDGHDADEEGDHFFDAEAEI